MKLIDKAALVAEIEKRKTEAESNCGGYKSYDEHRCDACTVDFYNEFLEILDTLEVKEMKKTMSIAYVVTRCEEHSDYVEKVFFDEDKAQEYHDQFKGNENEYARHITRVEVTL